VKNTAGRYSKLSNQPTKTLGQCGRLKCCLNYELDTYMDALRVFPNHVDRIKTKTGTAFLQKKDIFKNLMWYSYEKSNTLYPLTIERVKEISELNKQGVFPEDLQAVEVTKKTIASEKTDFVDVVGQFSLKGLERASKKKKEKAKNQNQQGAKPQQAGNQGNRPNGQKPAGANGPKPQANANKQKPKPPVNAQANTPQAKNNEGQDKSAKKPQHRKPNPTHKKPQQPNAAKARETE